MAETELQQMFDAFQDGGAIGGEQLRLCLQIAGLKCEKAPTQRLNKAQFVQLMQKLQAL